jgi:hypothetical protein
VLPKNKKESYVTIYYYFLCFGLHPLSVEMFLKSLKKIMFQRVDLPSSSGKKGRYLLYWDQE